MRSSSTWLALTFAAAATVALAHTHLQQAQPADGSVLAAAPKQIVLTFSEATRLTALVINKEGAQSAQQLAPLPEAPATRISVAAPALAPGRYSVDWRAVGTDRHVMSGKLSFTVDPTQTSSGAKPSAPAQEHQHR
jgi:copper transport protein